MFVLREGDRVKVGKIKSLRKKITLIYIGLVIVIAMVGLISAFNVYNLGKSIDGLITDNYKSIDACKNMGNCIESENRAILKYIQGEKDQGLEFFYKSNDEFYQWFHIEKNNITEDGERSEVDKLNEEYVNFVKLFSELQEYSSSHNDDKAKSFYEDVISVSIENIKNDLNHASKLNEKTMFDKKISTRLNAENSTKLICIISLIASLLGLIIAIICTNKYLRPIHLLTNTIKSVKEGEINKQAPIIYNDEIGMVAKEFNNMTNRLYEFEKSTKGSLLAEKNKFMIIAKSISDPLMVLDGSFKIKFVNNSCETFLGLNEEHIINKHFLQAINNGELYDHAFNVINMDLIDNGKFIEVVIGDKTYFFNVIVTSIKDKDPKSNGIIMLFRNVTELKQVEKIKTEFIGTISHELKTPLTSVMMGVGLMLDENLGSLNEKQSGIIETIKEDVQRLSELVSNLLKISKIQSDKAVFNRKKCDLNKLIKECAESNNNIAKNKNIILKLNLNNISMAMIDEEKMVWVLNNLLSNAIRYTDESGEIIVGSSIEKNNIKIYVEDTGRGIPENCLDKVFEKFFRVEEFDILPESTGLGLSIAKEIVEAHNGQIWCESVLDKGSKFTFTIPFVENEIRSSESWL